MPDNPLVNDDRSLRSTTPVEFLGSPPGLDLSTGVPPGLLGSAGTGQQYGMPGVLGSAGASTPNGTLGLQAPNMNYEQASQQIHDMFARSLPRPAQSTESQIFFSPSTGEVVVNGFRFNQRNATQALASEQWANQPRQRFTLPDDATDWREMSREEYNSYLDTIKNPGFGRRMAEGWETGWRGFGDIALGAGMALDQALTGTDDNQWLHTARANIQREYEENAPFILGLRDVNDVGSGLTYLAQMSMQGIPWFVETMVSMAAGAVIGGLVSGGAGAPAGAIEGFVGREALRQASRGAIETFMRNNIRRGATAYMEAAAEHGVEQVTRNQVRAYALRTGAATEQEVNQFFNFGERAYHMTRAEMANGSLGGGSGLAQRGQLAAMFGSNYMTGVGDIRNSIEDAGGDPTTAESVANIWGLALPYGLIESMGDLLVTQPIAHLVPGFENGPSRIGNAIRSGLVTAAGEGLEEGAQYVVTQQGVAGATNTPIDIEPYDLLENVIGGAAAGAPLGAITGARGHVNRNNTTPNNTVLPNTPDTEPPAAPPLAPAPTPAPTPVTGGPSIYEDPYALGQGSYEDVAPMGPVTQQYGANPDTTDYIPQINTPNLADMPDQEIPGQNLQPNAPTERQINIGNEGVAQVGDMVQWSPQGIQQFEQPRRVTSISPDKQYLFVEGSNTGIPVAETTIASRAPRSAQPVYPAHDAPVANHTWRPSAAIEAAAASNPAIRKLVDTVQRATEQGVFISPDNVTNADLIAQEALKPGFSPEHQAAAIMAPNEVSNVIRNHNRRMLSEALQLMDDSKNISSWPKEKLERAEKLAISGLVNMKDGFTEQQKDALKRLGGMARTAKSLIPPPGVRGAKAREDYANRERLTPSQKKNKKRKLAEAEEHRVSREQRQLRHAQEQRQINQRDDARNEEGPDNRLASEIFADAKKTKGAKGEALKKRNRVKEAAQAAAEASKAQPKAEPKVNPRPKSAESNDLKEAASIRRLAEPAHEVDQKRIDKAYTAGLKERETVNSLLRSIEALEGAAMRYQKTDPDFTDDTPYYRTKKKWPVVDGQALSINELRALHKIVSEEEHKVNDPERRAIAFNETIKSIWQDIVKEVGPASRMKGTKDFDTAVERFMPFVKRQFSEVSNWLNSKISDTLPPVRAAAQQALAKLATQTDEKPKRGVDKPKRIGSLMMPEYKSWVKVSLLDSSEVKGKKNRILTALNQVDTWLDDLRNGRIAVNRMGQEGIKWAIKQLDQVFAIWKAIDLNPIPLKYLTYLQSELKATLNEFTENSKSDEKPKRGVDKPKASHANRGYTIASRIMREEMKKNPKFNTFTSIHPATREYSNKLRDRINKEGGTNYTNKQLTNMLLSLKRRDRINAAEQNLNEKPQASTNEDNVLYKKVSVQVARAAVNKIQRLIAEDARFKSVSVVGNVNDLFEQMNDIVMTAPNGAKHTLAQYIMRQAQIMKNEKPEFRDVSLESVGVYYIQTHMTASGIVVPGYQHLIIMADYLKNEQRLNKILEHEYIVHSGLKALIPDPVKRALFLHRFSLIPGVHEMREYLLAQLPMYKNVSYLDQLEEVLAYHSMHGPLAVEQLLKSEEGINQETRQSLWEELVDIVKQWLKDTFGEKTPSDAALVMDDIIGALRQYAITGYMGNLEGVLDKYNAPRVDEELKSAFVRQYEARAKRAFDEAEPVNELLFGTNEDNDPMRPYRKQSYPDYMRSVLESNRDIIDKLRSVRDGGFATPIKEGLKKLSRELETMNNMKLRSTLIEQVLEVMHNTIRVARRIMTESMLARPYAELSAATAWARRMFGDKRPGSTKEQRNAYSSIALAATNSKLAKLTDEIVRAAPRILVRHPDGSYTINWSVFAQYNDQGQLSGGLLREGMFTREELLKGIPQYTVDSEGDVTQHGVAKFTEQQLNDGYEIYVAETTELGKSMMKIMEHTAIMLSRKNDVAIDKIMRENRFKPQDEAFANEALQRMFKLYADIAFHNYTSISRKARVNQATRARNVLAELQRTFHSSEKVKDWTDLSRTREDVKNKNPRGNSNDAFKWREQVDIHDDVKPFVNQIRWFLEYDDTFGDSRFARINSLGVSLNQQLAMFGAFQALLNAETEAHERENKAIQSIYGNYVELTRKGSWRVAVVARDANGEEFDIPPDLYAVLPVTFTESKREADELQQRLRDKFAGEHYFLDDNGEKVPITFDVGVRQAPGTQTMSDVPSIGEFLKVSEAVGLSINAKQMKEIANMIESASIRKRYGLQRSATPGVDFDILFNNNKTLTGRAWQAAKISQSWMLDAVMSDPRNKHGDWTLLARLQREFDIANRGAPEGVTPPASFVRNAKNVYLAERDLLRYANQLRHMAEHTTKRPTVNVRTTKGELKLKIENESEAHLRHAQALQKSLEKNELEVNLNDLISKTGPLRQQAVVMQLGTIAAGIMNSFTPLTHLPWVLTARHDRTGYGEGFEFSEVVAEIISAITHTVDLFRLGNNIDSLNTLLEEAKKGNNRTSFTLEELQFIYDETLDGILTPQQTYSMTGGTESNIRDLFWRNASKLALVPFANVELGTRTAAAIATYRMATRRYIQAGRATAESFKDKDTDQYKRMRKDIEYIVDFTQGDYTNINRPRGFRGDLAQYVMQYKMFPLITTLMIHNLPMAQKVAVLGVIGLLAGIKGEPFADDFADIYDTLMQNLGFKHDSIELEMTNFFESIMPGLSNWIMHGAVDQTPLSLGGTLSSRISLGDIIPLTGVFRPEADVGREIINAFGPAFAANADSIEWAGITADFMIQQLGMKPRTTSWLEIFRKIPQGQLRSFVDAAQMATTGQILDPSGRLTSDEVNALNVFSRALGFYPLEASRANTAVRLDRMHVGYMRAIRQRFVLAYAQAYVANDRDRMDRINREVDDWNDAVGLTGQDDMEIRNFRQAARRAGREAASTAIERTSRGAPDYSRIDRIAEITLADTEADDE